MTFYHKSGQEITIRSYHSLDQPLSAMKTLFFAMYAAHHFAPRKQRFKALKCPFFCMYSFYINQLAWSDPN